MSRLTVLSGLLSRRLNHTITKRLVSTSPKTNESSTSGASTPTVKDSEKNWISYGYDKHSKKSDRNAAHSGMFGSITLCLVCGGFLLAYMPDYTFRDWSIREAFLELRRREESGLPLIDPNLIDPSKIELPGDEELGDTEIII